MEDGLEGVAVIVFSVGERGVAEAIADDADVELDEELEGTTQNTGLDIAFGLLKLYQFRGEGGRVGVLNSNE